MNEHDRLRERLEIMVAKTKTAQALPPAGWWVGDAAGERRVKDDWEAGRAFWRQAHKDAQNGLEALEVGDLNMAEIYAWTATDHYVAALEARIRPSDLKDFARPARRRGRGAKK